MGIFGKQQAMLFEMVPSQNKREKLWKQQSYWTPQMDSMLFCLHHCISVETRFT
jgi:hypothetical protein